MSNLPPNKDELDDDNRGNRLSVDDTHAEQVKLLSAQQSISVHPYQRLTPDVVIDAVAVSYTHLTLPTTPYV